MPDENLQPYDGFSAVLDVHEWRLTGDAVLRLSNGNLVMYRQPPLKDDREHWESTPQHLKACVRMIKEAYGYPADSENLMRKLCDDVRMKEFWDWFVSIQSEKMKAHSSFCAGHETMASQSGRDGESQDVRHPRRRAPVSWRRDGRPLARHPRAGLW